MNKKEEAYHSLFERNNDGIFLVDSEGRFVAVNGSAERITGYTAQELNGMTFREIITPDELEKATRAFQLALQGGSPDLETVIRRKDERRVDILLTAGPIVIGDSVQGFFVVTKDITYWKSNNSLGANEKQSTYA